MVDRIKKTVRFTQEIQEKLNELKKIYKVEAENALLELIIKEVYELKKSKALIPFEEYLKKDNEIKKLFFELGKLKAELGQRDILLQERDRELQEKQKELEKEKGKTFWQKFFGR